MPTTAQKVIHLDTHRVKVVTRGSRSVRQQNLDLENQIKAALRARRPRAQFGGWGQRPDASTYDAHDIHLMGSMSEQPLAIVPWRTAAKILGANWMRGHSDIYVSDCYPRTLARVELVKQEYLLLVYRYDVVGVVMVAQDLLTRLRQPLAE